MKKLKTIHYVIGAAILLLIFSNTGNKEGQKLGADPTETIWGHVTYNGVTQTSATIKATVYSSADCDPDPDVYSGSINKIDENGKPIYLIQVQWRGCGDNLPGDKVVVEATSNGQTGKTETTLTTTPQLIDIALTGTAPVVCKAGYKYDYYPNGKMISKEYYKLYNGNCVLSGTQYYYYDTGKMKEKLYYTNGIQTGTQYGYWSNGKYSYKETYNSKGLKNGYQYYYNTLGKQTSREYWVNGVRKN